MQCYPGYTHNYYVYDNKRDVFSEKSNWPEVFEKVDKWLKNKK